MSAALIQAPANTASQQYQTLAYIEGYDAILNGDYAFVAYKETDASGGAWRVRISGKQTAGGVFEPEAMRLQARQTGAQGKPFFTWGFSMDPSASDPRSVQFRVYVRDGKPADVEIFLQLRKFDGSAETPKTVSFPWPA